MPKYQLIESFGGDPSTVIQTFTANNDDEAITIAQKEKNKDKYKWSYIWLKRIDQEEKTTNIPIPPR